MSILESLNQIIGKINNAVNITSNTRITTSDNIKLVAVTKNHNVAAIQEAIAAGVITIGENRVQEAVTKAKTLEGQVEWHLIGHLQSNKVRQAVALFNLIHSVDSERLVVEIDHVAGKMNKRQDVLLQINVANEDTKFGISTEELMPMARFISNLEHVRLCGLMTIAPFYENPEFARPVFKETYQLFMELKAANLANTNIEWLSMGMTNDYIVAIEEGSNLVRIGTGIFGKRQY